MQFYGDNPSYALGRVEDVHDPLKAGRVRVRVFGLHSESASELPSDRLPWSQVVMPVTGAGFNGVGTSPTGLKYGSTVFGIFLDGENKQQLLVIGSVPGIEDSATTIDEINADIAPTKPVEKKPGKVQKTVSGDDTVAPLDFINDFFVKTLKYTQTAAAGIVTYFESKLKFGTKRIKRDILNLQLRGCFDDPKKIDAYAAQNNLNPRVPEATLLYVHALMSVSSWPKVQTQDTASSNVKLKPAVTVQDHAVAASQAIVGAKQNKSVISKQDVDTNVVTPKPPEQKPDIKTTAKKPTDPDYGKTITYQELLSKFKRCTRTDSSGNPLNGLVIHATACFNNTKFGLSHVEAVRDEHMNSRGWNDIGYHFMIGIEGEIYICRNINQQGAHAGAKRKSGDQYPGKSWNYQTVGVALMGGLGDPPRKADGSIDKKAASDMIINGKGLQDRLITSANGRMTKAYTVKQLNALSEFIKTFLIAFPNSQVFGHNQVDDKGKVDPYFDVSEYLADRLKIYTVKK